MQRISTSPACRAGRSETDAPVSAALRRGLFKTELALAPACRRTDAHACVPGATDGARARAGMVGTGRLGEITAGVVEAGLDSRRMKSEGHVIGKYLQSLNFTQRRTAIHV